MFLLPKSRFLSAALAFSLGTMLILKSSDLSEGVQKGLSVCSLSVIPSLFPFMVLSVYICKSSLSEAFAFLLRPLTKLFKIPSSSAAALFSSLIGGYPTGAKCISDLVSEGSLDRKTASKMLCYCVNAGPPFVISAVGTGIFKSAKIGFLILFAQLLSLLLMALFLSFSIKKSAAESSFSNICRSDGASVFVESVISAAENCFNMCAFIVLSFGALEIFQSGNLFSRLSENPILKSLFFGFFEVTSGVLSAGNIPGFVGIIAAGALCSFSGISVMLQVASVTEKSKIPLLPFIVSRFFHAAFTAGFLRLFLLFSTDSAEVFSVRGNAFEAVLSASAPAAVSLLCMASLFLLSLVPQKSEKEPLFSRIKYKFKEFKHSQIK